MTPSNEDFNINHHKKDLKVRNFDTNISSFLDDFLVDPLCDPQDPIQSQEWDLFWEELDLILPNLLFDTVRKWGWHNFWEDMDLILQNNFLLFDTTEIEGAEWEQSEKEETTEKPFTDLTNIQTEEAKKSGKEEIKKKALTELSKIQTEEAESKPPGKEEIKKKTLTDLSNIQTEEAKLEQSVTGETKEKSFTDLLNIQNNQESLSVERNVFLSSFARKPRTKIARAERRFSTSWSENEIGFQNSKSYETDVKKGKKICSHCKAEKTPQWRAGPLGPNTLCNACGVRYKSGRLLPEYRPAASPTFDVSKHSNVHRKILQMRACSFR